MAARDLSIVVPTFNERENIAPLIGRIERVLDGVDYEIVVVDDDSPDGTAELAFDLSKNDPRIGCIRRVGRRGLSSACIEGMCASGADFLAVIDADLQHDETKLLDMLRALRADTSLDLVIGSRFASGGSTGSLSDVRVRMNRFAATLGTRFLGVKTSDPMSGFFMVRRTFFNEVVHRLSGVGFKILLDILASSRRPVRYIEVPYDMRARSHGESKVDSVVLWHYLVLLLDKTIGPIVPVRFIFFVSMGVIGALFHLLVLGTSMFLFGWSFLTGQTLAVVFAMTVNFFTNNAFTYRDRRLRGWGVVRGLFVFYLVCSVGAVLSLMLATYLYERGLPWYAAGLLGAAVGAIWNFALTYHYAWAPTERAP